MRDYKTTMEVVNALTAVIVGSDSTGCTANGATVDTHGFSDVLLVACMGQIYSTNATPAELVIDLLECDASTGPFTAIGDGAINGTAQVKINVKGHSAVTTPANYMGKWYERLNDKNRKRYLTVRATVKGTSAAKVGGPVSVALVLGRPSDTLYIQNPASVGTGNTAFFAVGGGTYFLVP